MNYPGVWGIALNRANNTVMFVDHLTQKRAYITLT